MEGNDQEKSYGGKVTATGCYKRIKIVTARKIKNNLQNFGIKEKIIMCMFVIPTRENF